MLCVGSGLDALKRPRLWFSALLGRDNARLAAAFRAWALSASYVYLFAKDGLREIVEEGR